MRQPQPLSERSAWRRADPTPVDREALEAIFSSKVSYLQSCVEFLNLAIASNDSGKLVEALEELENQVGAPPRQGAPCQPPLTRSALTRRCAPACPFGAVACPGVI